MTDRLRAPTRLSPRLATAPTVTYRDHRPQWAERQPSGMDLPATIGRYRVRGVLGSGGFATVFHAVDEGLDDDVAIKVLADNWSYDPDVRSRFISEARIMRSIQSDAVAPVFDIGETDGRPYFVMALADRGTLDERLVDGTPVPLSDVRQVVETLADALGVLHGAGVVHRDVKPANLLVRSARRTGASHGADRLVGTDERLLLSDFGLAKDLLAASGLTVSGGTPGYVAPEQMVPGGIVDARADVYAATALTCRLWTGRVPDGELPGTLSAEQQSMLGGAAAAIERSLRTDPAARPADVDAWREEMLRALDRTPSSAAQHDAPEPPEDALPTEPVERAPSRRTVLLGAGALAVLGVGGAVVLVTGGDAAASPVIGPERIPVGARAIYTAVPERLLGEGQEVASTVWVDWNDRRISDDSFFVEPSSTGRLSFALEVTPTSGAVLRHDVTVEVVEAGSHGPVVGPDEIPVGGVGFFTIDPQTRGTSTPVWVDSSGTEETAETYFVRPTSSGSIEFTVRLGDGADPTEVVHRISAVD